MVKHRTLDTVQVADLEGVDWQPLPGGELEGRRPKVMCPTCREKLRRLARRSAEGGQAAATLSGSSTLEGDRQPAARPTLCFECYRTDLARERAMRSIVRTLTSSDGVDAPGWNAGERIQALLPFEPVNRARLDRLRAERSTARAATARFVDKRRQAQIAARHALQQIAAGLHAQGVDRPARHRAITQATHAAELQLPDAWLPFVCNS